ncbi:MAG: protein phosphatase 2C domain-containing protein [Spirochaetales bacterium]|nr:protein phosphatase 2C domain-containing protein [Spirochaetales bacterium]
MHWNKIKTHTHCFLSGRDFETSEVVGLCTIEDDVAALALSVGKNNRFHQIGRPNEDSVGAVYSGEKHLFLGVAADSHFGGLMSDAVVKTFVDTALEGDFPGFLKDNDARQNLAIFKNYVVEHINIALGTTLVHLTTQNPGPPGATTLIVVVVWNDRFYFASIGDSVLYYGGQGSLRIINPRENNYLDNHRLNPGMLNFGTGEINQGAAIVLATDGLPECIYGVNTLTPRDIAAKLDASPTVSVGKLVELAFSKGGEDNLGLVVYRHRE